MEVKLPIIVHNQLSSVNYSFCGFPQKESNVFLESMEVNEHTEVLIKAIVRGDKKAFGQLFRMWYVRLCLYAESIVRDRDMAEDLVQNLFCMLWEKREEIDIRESMKAYLYCSVYHAALNSLKHEKVKLAF